MKYYISIPDVASARGADAGLAFDGVSAEALASAVEGALRGDGLFQRWRAKQEEPDDVDASLGAIDPGATVSIEKRSSGADLRIETKLPHALLRHRLNLLIGSN
jgi:hypothetical protein